MKGIMFNTKYGLESAVLNGSKTRTWRADKQPRYEVGEVVAVKQCYCWIMGVNKDFLENKVGKYNMLPIFASVGWRNKMFVKNELMPHHIRITAVKKCKLQEITDEECIKECIIKRVIRPFSKDIEAYSFHNGRLYATPKQAFENLINKLNSKGYWECNPDGYAYEFELVD